MPCGNPREWEQPTENRVNASSVPSFSRTSDDHSRATPSGKALISKRKSSLRDERKQFSMEAAESLFLSTARQKPVSDEDGEPKVHPAVIFNQGMSSNRSSDGRLELWKDHECALLNSSKTCF